MVRGDGRAADRRLPVRAAPRPRPAARTADPTAPCRRRPHPGRRRHGGGRRLPDEPLGVRPVRTGPHRRRPARPVPLAREGGLPMRHRMWAYLAAAWAIAFAAPHVYWASGAVGGLDTALSEAIIRDLGLGFQLLNAGIALFCLCGAATALATLRVWPPRWARLARRVLLGLTGMGAFLLLARSIDIYVEFGLGLTGIRQVPPEYWDNYRHMAAWFLFFWEPWFAFGALAWTRLTWILARTGRAGPARATRVPAARGRTAA
ncbi:MAG: DUF3995 domain-containing protein [Streptosporangiales bacterium]|nr:DUF3995 domain-containing protein [Streptosporangiales bacterium]